MLQLVKTTPYCIQSVEVRGPGPREREMARRNTLATPAPLLGPREHELAHQRQNSCPQQTPPVSDVILWCPGSQPTSCAQPRECSNAGHAGRLLVNMCIGLFVFTCGRLSLFRARSVIPWVSASWTPMQPHTRIMHTNDSMHTSGAHQPWPPTLTLQSKP